MRFTKIKERAYWFVTTSFCRNELGDIFAYNEELGENPILWYHGDIPSDL